MKSPRQYLLTPLLPSVLSPLAVFFSALCLAGLSSAHAQTGSFWELEASDSRGSYVSTGASASWWKDHNVSVSYAGSAGTTVTNNVQVRYDDAGSQFHIAFGSAPKVKLLRIRYEIEAFYSENDVNLRYQVGSSTLSQTGDAEVYGIAFNALFDAPPIFMGRITPFVGAGGFFLGLDIDLPSGVGIPPSLSSSVRTQIQDNSNALVSAVAGNVKFAYGYGALAGFRIELNPFLAIDVGYLFARVESLSNKGEALYIADQFQQARASVVLRY